MSVFDFKDFATSRIEISESAYRKNIRFLKTKIGANAVFSSVIKGNAYGHCISAFLPMAEKCGIRHFSVFSAAEACKAINCRTQKSHIMIMGAISNDELGWAMENDLSFYIFEMDRLRKALEISQKMKIPARIHLEIETGLNRTGLNAGQINEAVDLIRNNRANFIIEGLCTHYAGAESVANYLRIKNQINIFNQLKENLKKQGIIPRSYHSACSAAALIYPETVMDMVRFGIAQYGFWPTEEVRVHHWLQQNNGNFTGRNPLNRVISWKSRVMSIKEVPPGEFISYGTSFMSSRKMKIATVPVGYYHGFSRNLSNLGRVLINGHRAYVVGLVNMNMFIVDVSSIKDVKKGDEVVIIGKQKKQQITVASFSDMANNLNYEVLTRIPSEIPRIVVA